MSGGGGGGGGGGVEDFGVVHMVFRGKRRGGGGGESLTGGKGRIIKIVWDQVNFILTPRRREIIPGS